jgi:hypothetical protein
MLATEQHDSIQQARAEPASERHTDNVSEHLMGSRKADKNGCAILLYKGYGSLCCSSDFNPIANPLRNTAALSDWLMLRDHRRAHR